MCTSWRERLIWRLTLRRETPLWAQDGQAQWRESCVRLVTIRAGLCGLTAESREVLESGRKPRPGVGHWESCSGLSKLICLCTWALTGAMIRIDSGSPWDHQLQEGGTI